MIGVYQRYTEQPVRVWERFRTGFRVLEEDLNRRVSGLVRGYTIHEDYLPSPDTFLLPAGDPDDVALFVFRRDSLVFWDDNHLPVPPGINSFQGNGDMVLRLKNGWFLYHWQTQDPYTFVGCRVIRTEYSFRNDFISDHFTASLQCSPSVGLLPGTGGYPVFSSGGRYLFSLDFSSFRPEATPGAPFAFFLFVAGALCLFRFIYVSCQASRRLDQHAGLFVAVFAGTVILLRVFQRLAHFPDAMVRWDLFSPAGYSSSAVLSSLGDYSLDALLALVISLVFYLRFRPSRHPGTLSAARKRWRILIVLLVLLTVTAGVAYLGGDLVLNSSFSLDLRNLSGLSWLSGFGIAILTFLMAVHLLVTLRMAEILFRHFFPATVFSGFWLINRNGRRHPIRNILFFLCFYALFATFILDRANRTRETEKVGLLAGKLSSRRNPVTEVMYDQAEKRILADPVVGRWFSGHPDIHREGTDSLATYLKKTYFTDYWRKYQIQITCCDPGQELKIQPQGYVMNCRDYFNGILGSYGKATQNPGLFSLDYGFSREYYLAMISEGDTGRQSGTTPVLIVEFNLKSAYPDPGYPALLTDRPRNELPNLTDYSYGVYRSGRLIRSVGFHEYKTELGQYGPDPGTGRPIREDDRVHYRYHVSDSDTLLITRRKDTLLTFITPFSYLFILFSLVSVMAASWFRLQRRARIAIDSLRFRLQVALIGVLLITLVAVGLVQLFNIVRINQKKNQDNLRERAYSVLVEIQHKYAGQSGMQEIDRSTLEDLLVKWSNVFFSDINIYGSDGMLVASSRPQIFEEGLLSGRMNAEAYRMLVSEKNSMVLHPEAIGKMKFNSAYLPFYNDRDQLLGFLNLPYFARQDEAKKEISAFLVTFMNVYILLILLGLLVSVLISNYITAPLGLLAAKLSQLRLGRASEKIVWHHRDEIGQLVAEYNRMTDELARSAELLARSAREGAWRQMARQVAHEIKNPLTPIKLSAQHLEKAWKDKAPDWDQRLARFTATLTEQIDALSRIASDFSDFARMPAAVMEPVNLAEVVEFVLTLYRGTTQVTFEFRESGRGRVMTGDRTQLIRIFTNLVNNAVQAIGDRPGGVVRIDIEHGPEEIIVRVADNGPGIAPEQAGRIFQPDFTTKTTGMGLGLAIVKGIVEGMQGQITFRPEEPSGTSFIIRFPAYEKREETGND